jgi:hypothetical protein
MSGTPRRIRLSVDYSQDWPLSDIMWDPEEQPAWDELLTPELIADLRAWARFFNTHADWETGLYGSEELRRWFDLEGFRLRTELVRQVGDRFDVELVLWF